MNVHNKLKGLGFVKTDFYKINDSFNPSRDAMILDNVEKKLVYDSNGRYTFTNVPKKHPKSNSFWKLVFNEQYVLWISVVGNKIHTIMLEDKDVKFENRFITRKDVRILYDTSYPNLGKFIISGKNDILNVLPKEIKREFVLKNILK